MKKYFIGVVMALFVTTFSFADKGINVGLTLSSKLFEVDGASETFTAGTTNVNSRTKQTPRSEEAEALVGFASFFIEKDIGERFGLGIDYVPMSLESETDDNIKQGGTDGTNIKTTTSNTVQVDFKDLTTIYAKLNLGDAMYVKVGHVQVKAETNENLGTGSSYGNVDLDGHTFAVGYSGSMPTNDMFFRIEGSYVEIDGATLNSSVNSATNGTRTVTVDGITGYGASVSIGKSF